LDYAFAANTNKMPFLILQPFLHSLCGFCSRALGALRRCHRELFGEPPLATLQRPPECMKRDISAASLPSPLVGEGGAKRRMRGRIRGRQKQFVRGDKPLTRIASIDAT
jgi:hypothetical protein